MCVCKYVFLIPIDIQFTLNCNVFFGVDYRDLRSQSFIIEPYGGQIKYERSLVKVGM